MRSRRPPVRGMAVNGLAFGLVHLHVHGLTHDAAGFHLRWVSGGLFVLGGVVLSALFTLCRMRTGRCLQRWRRMPGAMGQ